MSSCSQKAKSMALESLDSRTTMDGLTSLSEPYGEAAWNTFGSGPKFPQSRPPQPYITEATWFHEPMGEAIAGLPVAFSAFAVLSCDLRLFFLIPASLAKPMLLPTHRQWGPMIPGLHRLLEHVHKT